MASTTSNDMTEALMKQIQAMMSNGSLNPEAIKQLSYAFGKPLSEQEFKQRQASQGATVIKTADIAKDKLRQKLQQKRLQRSPAQVREKTASSAIEKMKSNIQSPANFSSEKNENNGMNEPVITEISDEQVCEATP